MKTLAELEVMRKVCSNQMIGGDKFRGKQVLTEEQHLELNNINKWKERLIKIENKMLEITELEINNL
jgi:hypothetical protein